MAYFAHHSGMLQSSLAEAGLAPYLVFQWLLERADEEGVVRDVRPRLIARELSVLDASLFTEKAVEAALGALQRPDPTSKHQAHEGRRIIPNAATGSSFVVVSYVYYNEEWAQERRRKKDAKRQRRHRARQAENGHDDYADELTSDDVTRVSRDVTSRHADVTPSSETKSQAKKRLKEKSRTTKSAKKRERESAERDEPPMTVVAYTARAREIAVWQDHRRPCSEEQFAADFEAQFQMSWPTWCAIRSRMETVVTSRSRR